MVQVALRQQHRDFAAFQRCDHLGEALRQRRRDAFERLVEKEQARAGGERARERDELLLAAGELQGAARREIPALPG